MKTNLVAVKIEIDRLAYHCYKGIVLNVQSWEGAEIGVVMIAQLWAEHNTGGKEYVCDIVDGMVAEFTASEFAKRKHAEFLQSKVDCCNCGEQFAAHDTTADDGKRSCLHCAEWFA